MTDQTIQMLELRVSNKGVQFSRQAWLVQKSTDYKDTAEQELLLSCPDDLKQGSKKIYTSMLGAISNCSTKDALILMAWVTLRSTNTLAKMMRVRMEKMVTEALVKAHAHQRVMTQFKKLPTASVCEIKRR